MTTSTPTTLPALITTWISTISQVVTVLTFQWGMTMLLQGIRLPISPTTIYTTLTTPVMTIILVITTIHMQIPTSTATQATMLSWTVKQTNCSTNTPPTTRSILPPTSKQMITPTSTPTTTPTTTSTLTLTTIPLVATTTYSTHTNLSPPVGFRPTRTTVKTPILSQNTILSISQSMRRLRTTPILTLPLLPTPRTSNQATI